MKSICVYCGSSPGERPEYKAGAIALGNEMVGRGLTLVYGGGNIGLMGIVADAVLRAATRSSASSPSRWCARRSATRT